jgi:hypothetical protein
MGKLRQLYLNNNKIVSLNNRVFRYLDQLQTLDLCYNALKNIDAEVFSNLSKLRSLFLCHNNVSRINITFLHAVITIGKVDLEGNPWICDCDSANVYSSCAKNNNCNLNLTCEFPDGLKQRHWSVIDDLGCKPTTVSTIARRLPEKETTATTDQTEESKWPTMSSEPSEEDPEVTKVTEDSEEIDFWLWIMIALISLCWLTCVFVITLGINTYLRKCRSPNVVQGRSDFGQQQTEESETVFHSSQVEQRDVGNVTSQ